MTRAPAQTSTSLLASATMTPRRIAAKVGANPAAPTIPAITHSAGRCAASISDCRAACGLDAGSGERLPQRRDNGRVRRSRQNARPRRAPARPSRAGLRFAVSASTTNASGLRCRRSTVFCPIEPVEPRIVTLRIPSLPFVAPAGSGAGGWRPEGETPAEQFIAMPERCGRRSGSSAPPPGSPQASRRGDREARHAQE